MNGIVKTSARSGTPRAGLQPLKHEQTERTVQAKAEHSSQTTNQDVTMIRTSVRNALFFTAVIGTFASLQADDSEPRIAPGTRFAAQDSFGQLDDPSSDAQECIAGLCWDSGNFDVICDTASTWGGDRLVRFPTPVVSGDSRNDLVSMEWYLARDADGKIVEAPAIVVVHESGSRMEVGRLFARGLRQQQFHTFLIHLPFYGERRTGSKRPESADLLSVMRQAVADVRRAHDAVSVLPFVDAERISLQGTSLGGFVSATAASLDCPYHAVFLMLAGGDLYDMIQHGAKDTAKVREKLREAGVTGEALRQLTRAIEPTRVAHRLKPDRTWLYSGKSDTVVPLKNALVLARAAGLDSTHHIQMNANHYTGIIYLPFIIKHISDRAR